MKTKTTRQTHAYKIDLTKIDGKGEFPCPCCGNEISPDDEKEEAYSIVETKVNGCDLEELVICCKRCRSEIHIIGFSLLARLADIDVATTGHPLASTKP